MINFIKPIFPEIFLIISICVLLMIGVFVKKSYNLINRLSIIVLTITAYLIIKNYGVSQLLFQDSFIKDNFSNFIKIVLIISTIFILISSNQFINFKKISIFEYPIIILISILGMFFMISSNDLILFYLGLELQSLSLYILAAIDRNNLRSTESGVKYFVLSALSSGLLLYGCSLLYGFAGSTNFLIIQDQLTYENTGAVFAMVFILVGLSFKISAVPFHMWTPDVYEGAPTSITSYLSVVPKIAAFAVLIRFMYTPFQNILTEWQGILIFISVGSMILGAVAAINQQNIKRLMAYSSIGHIGYALAGVSTGSINGYKSAIIYLCIYAVMNIGMFACIFSMKKEDKYFENINDLSGISKSNPLIALSFLIILFSLAGIPPLGGFFAKFFVFMAVIEQEMFILAIIGLLTTVISAFYYLRIIKIIYFDKEILKFDAIRDLSLRSTILTSCIILSFFFLYPSIFDVLLKNFF